MSQRKYFGTDGIRGHVGLSNINPEFVLKLGWAVGCVLANGERKKVVIGKDTRVSGYMLESALEAGLSAAGVDVALLGPMPTPGIAYLTQTLRANAGIVISASHNLFEDNGIKFFSADGGKLPDSVELAIEAQLEKQLQTVPSAKLGKATRINDAAGRYIEFCKSTIPSLSRLSNLKIVVDCANGATYHIAPNVFSELGADVVPIGVKPDGFNINQECGSTAPELLREKVIAVGADIGIGLDGDGDRVILVDSLGNLVDGDQIIYIIAKDRHQRGVLHGGVVGTLMSNYGLELAITSLGIPFQRSKVGDRYVLETLREKDWKIGGETSGHIVCLDKTTTGDGIVAALQVLSIMVKQNKALHELTAGIQLLPQTLVNLKTNNAALLASNPDVIQAVKNLENHLNGEGRVLLRPSGTEPLLRVMVEGANESIVKQQAQMLCDDISQIDKKLTESLQSI
ncbi:phosphoglucosamine mutase [Legionella pneumophila]|uniref:Phosphoglucosamine mutase n=1 Tax=Legionella pneumophila subsp. pascullei TaxID=91890 RepID=A0AAX2IYZ9_LEGPN|nr:phosphoglucosamine mutase [Legionella pneumophila]AMP90733.1 phosphoglucosamine mutase [Legionella pneumophila subsp. pascullei]AMP93716.1 phosphoglucosamine mutase [Legionella pneumophila subsp. pascullei]AMP96634.1 phosphoglucosamine mutase [Legionella pneumophila subsp. pascullei]SQG91675.1 phosphoglucomutase/phosphomannomutase [Legionella pneumophila subsp. pascullei]VEH08221.1 phosphoglucomutase/phosphomannomutase [Legionella pneumophila subsp. pascullei]